MATFDTVHAAADHAGIGVPTGTSNPGTPSTGDMFLRTDIDGGLLITYDGTRWLGPVEHVTFSYPSTLIPVTAGTGQIQARVPVDGTYQLYIMAAHATVFVLTTNSGSHYWALDFKWVNSANSETSLATADTSADSASTWVRKTLTENAVLDSTARVLLMSVAKSGTPGNLYMTASVRFRRIVT